MIVQRMFSSKSDKEKEEKKEKAKGAAIDAAGLAGAAVGGYNLGGAYGDYNVGKKAMKSYIKDNPELAKLLKERKKVNLDIAKESREGAKIFKNFRKKEILSKVPGLKNKLSLGIESLKNEIKYGADARKYLKRAKNITKATVRDAGLSNISKKNVALGLAGLGVFGAASGKQIRDAIKEKKEKKEKEDK